MLNSAMIAPTRSQWTAALRPARALSDRRRPSQTKRTQLAIGEAAALAALAVAPALPAAGFRDSEFFASWLVAVE